MQRPAPLLPYQSAGSVLACRRTACSALVAVLLTAAVAPAAILVERRNEGMGVALESDVSDPVP